MALRARIGHRLTGTLVLTALIPVLAGIYLAISMVRQTVERFYQPEVGSRLDQSLGLYQELARAVKATMRAEASTIAADATLQKAASDADPAAAEKRLHEQFGKHPSLVALRVESDGKKLAEVTRGRPLDESRENGLTVLRALRDGADDENEEGARLVAEFAADKARFEELSEMSQFVATYRQIEGRRESDEDSYLKAFALLLGITFVVALGTGTLLSRSVARRVTALADATARVGAGDLAIRVPESGSDEIADLARAFNRMLGEVEHSRSRIEYLQRIGAWQEMARRLAHEIKNPLTPIQLAVQEVHRRYAGAEPEYVKLLDTTLEVVEDEVGTLRRLVSEFSDFARLPRAVLEPADLGGFLEEQRRRLSLGADEAGEVDASIPDVRSSLSLDGVIVDFELPGAPAPVEIDRQMLRRVLVNLLRNSQQAITAAQRGGRIKVSLRPVGDAFELVVDDDGPGIPEEIRATLFDPYVTTKTDGTGLGLAIVKKIVIEHGGSIVATGSPEGGARVKVTLPRRAAGG